MVNPFLTHNSRIRRDFGKIEQVIRLPNLVEIQHQSYDEFLQLDKKPEERGNIGLQEVFNSVFPIQDFSQSASIEFEKYTLDKPKYDVDECRQRGITYAAPLRITVRLVVWEVDKETDAKKIRDIKEQDVYLGEIPLMTLDGSFIINGTERVVASQLHRSPGVFFDHDAGKTHASGKLLYSARIIPYRGSWLDFEFDHKDLLYVRIDRRRKMHATILLKALGYSTEELLNYFYHTETITFQKGKIFRSLDIDYLEGQRIAFDIIDPKSREVLVKKNCKIGKAVAEKIRKAKIKHLPIAVEELMGKVAAANITDPSNRNILFHPNDVLTRESIETLRKKGIDSLDILFIDGINMGSYLRDTLAIDRIETPDEAVIEIYRRLRPGEPPTLETARALFDNLFFNPDRYDLSPVGRLKINYKFGLDTPLDHAVLTKRDLLEVVRYLIDLKNGKGSVDDIDHLGNRRVRSVGELLKNQIRIGLVRMERAIRERMSLQDVETLMPHDLINPKPIMASVREFFGSSQLSQFMDQTNPLAEVTHKRRLSALGPGGLTRERAGFEVRDVHPTHYGRICP
ncbi:MAG: DNA-directed RNA polymerase subunit beta, partial [Deltaproteobacteria bacterium]|nr:DNA-directed RNA polymerase subunit beta [Deltaproteobacteria bacterium]